VVSREPFPSMRRVSLRSENRRRVYIRETWWKLGVSGCRSACLRAKPSLSRPAPYTRTTRLLPHCACHTREHSGFRRAPGERSISSDRSRFAETGRGSRPRLSPTDEKRSQTLAQWQSRLAPPAPKERRNHAAHVRPENWQSARERRNRRIEWVTERDVFGTASPQATPRRHKQGRCGEEMCVGGGIARASRPVGYPWMRW